MDKSKPNGTDHSSSADQRTLGAPNRNIIAYGKNGNVRKAVGTSLLARKAKMQVVSSICRQHCEQLLPQI
jgi:hypothetical protein